VIFFEISSSEYHWSRYFHCHFLTRFHYDSFDFCRHIVIFFNVSQLHFAMLLLFSLFLSPPFRVSFFASLSHAFFAACRQRLPERDHSAFSPPMAAVRRPPPMLQPAARVASARSGREMRSGSRRQPPVSRFAAARRSTMSSFRRRATFSFQPSLYFSRHQVTTIFVRWLNGI
jgi:hypothetical protein